MPTLRDSNVTLTDSHSILIYLCEQYGGKVGAKLWPSDPIDRINVLNTLFYSGTLLFRRDSDAIVRNSFTALTKESLKLPGKYNCFSFSGRNYHESIEKGADC